MKIKDILAKVTKGETLTAEEKTFLEQFDPDKSTNDAAAAARRKAEQDLQTATTTMATLQAQVGDLQKKLDDGNTSKMTDLQKAQTQIETLTKQIGDLTKSIETEKGEKSTLLRQTKIDELARASGIRFVNTVDAKIMNRALTSAFEGLSGEDLADTSKVTPIIQTFRQVNKGVIVDTTGFGSGFTPDRTAGTGNADVNPWKKDTFNLTQQGKIMKENPQAAEHLKAAAGVNKPAA